MVGIARQLLCCMTRDKMYEASRYMSWKKRRVAARRRRPRGRADIHSNSFTYVVDRRKL